MSTRLKMFAKEKHKFIWSINNEEKSYNNIRTVTLYIVQLLLGLMLVFAYCRWEIFNKKCPVS